MNLTCFIEFNDDAPFPMQQNQKYTVISFARSAKILKSPFHAKKLFHYRLAEFAEKQDLFRH
jgi:hypothetical protein